MLNQFSKNQKIGLGIAVVGLCVLSLNQLSQGELNAVQIPWAALALISPFILAVWLYKKFKK